MSLKPSRTIKFTFFAVCLILSTLGTVSLVGSTPNITVTKTDTLVTDVDSDGNADPGDTIRYTIEIQNTGTSNATNVSLNDTIDADTTLLGAVHVSPIAAADSYDSLGNVGIDVPAANGLLLNDADPDNTVSNSIVEVQGSAANVGSSTATTQGGTVIVQANGAFVYIPPPGFEGDDTFTYTLSDLDPLTPNDTDTVTISVSEVIWFIDGTQGSQGSGTLDSPFNTIDGTGYEATAADEPGDTIYIFDNDPSGTYSGSITLQNNQVVIGEGSTASIPTVAGFIAPPFSRTLPTPTGTVTARPTINGGAGIGISLGQNNTLRGFNIGNSSTSLFGNTVGTLNVSEMAINAGSGSAVQINGGALNVSLNSVSSGVGGNVGISLQNTTGSFTVVGSGTAGSGGTIANKTAADGNAGGTGIVLNNVTNVEFNDMTLNNFSNFGIQGTNVNGFVLADSTVGASGTIGTNAGLEEGAINLTNLSGTASITGNTINNSLRNNIFIDNNTGTLNLTMNDNTVTGAGAGGFRAEATSSATMNISGLRNTFNSNSGTEIQVVANGNANVDVDLGDGSAANENVIGTSSGFDPASGIVLDGRQNATITFNILANELRNLSGSGIIVAIFDSATGDGNITGNEIRNTEFGWGIRANTETNNGNGRMVVNIANNLVGNAGGIGQTTGTPGGGIEVNSQQGGAGTTGTGDVDARIVGNTITINGVDSALQHFTDTGNSLCLDIQNNSITGAATSAFAGNGSTHFVANPVAGTAGTVTYVGYLAGNLGGTFTGNGNTSDVAVAAGNAGEATVFGTEPTAVPSCDSPSVSAPAPDMMVSAPINEIETLANLQVEALDEEITELVVETEAEEAIETIVRASNPRPFGLASFARSGETINQSIGTMEPGQSVTIVFDVTVDDPTSATEVCNQGTVTADGSISVLSDDPDDATSSADETCTAVELTPVCVDETVTTFAEFNAAVQDYNANCSNGDTKTLNLDGNTITYSSALSALNNATTAVLEIKDGTLNANGMGHVLLMLDGAATFDTTLLTGGTGPNGGAIQLESNTNATLINTTVTGNSSVTAAALLNNGGTMSLTNVTVSNNTISAANNSLGSVWNRINGANVPTLNLNNTIIGNTIDTNGLAVPDCRNNAGIINFSAGTSNLIELDQLGGVACDTAGTNTLSGDPVLGTLGNNGGGIHTMALLSSSPALNAADNSVCPADDQRGVSRPQGATCDIGAFESFYCLAGTYLASPGATSCTLASVGNFVPTDGAFSQSACLLGRYQDQEGQTQCIDAPIGSYVDTTGATSFTSCPANKTTAATGSASVDACFSPLVINEVDYDQPTPPTIDREEFIELKNIGGAPINLDLYSIDLIDGAGGGATSYTQIGLPNLNLAADDYYVICSISSTVPNCDLTTGLSTFIQNGSPDAIALLFNGAIADTLSYGGDTGAPYTEGTGAPADPAGSAADIDKGLSRTPDGADTDDNSADFSVRCITPGESNTTDNTNCRPGSITVIKSATPADGTDFVFTMTRPGNSDATATLDDDTDPTRSNNFTVSLLDAGDYDITEALPAGWQLDSVDCGVGVTTTDITDGVTVSLAQGQDVTCTFNNSQQVVDLRLAKSDSGITAEPGDTVVYTLSYENTQLGGPVDTATNVILTETVPPNTTFNATASGGVWSCADGSPGGTTCTQTIGSVAPSASGSTTFAVDVDNPFSATGGIQIQNTATISSDQSDRAPGNNTVIEQTPITAAPELAITKSDGGGSYLPGETIVYTVGVTNTGNRIAPSVVVSETVPAYTTFNAGASSPGWTCSPPAGPAGANCTIIIPSLDNTPVTTLFAVDVDATLPPSVTSTDNHIDVRSSSVFPESNTANNEFQLTTQLNNRGSITIIKDVIYNADIDTDSDHDFIFTSPELGGFMLDDPTVDDADGVSNTELFSSLTPGSYTVREGPNGNWIQSVLCVGDDNITYLAPDIGATIDLDPGEDVVCTFTNERVTYELTYTKVLAAGTPAPASPWEFTLASLRNLVPGDIDQDFGVVTTAPAAGGNSTTLTVPLDAYKVGEVVPAGYTLVQIDCGPGGLSTSPPLNDQFTIILDQNLTCTFTNETTQATITLNKAVTNDNGGTAGVNDFGLTIGGTPVNSGDSVMVDANVPVAINEAGLADYDFVSITGDAECPAVLGGTITPDPGADITCTINNDDKPATIVIVKDTVPDDPQDFEFSISGGLLPATFTLDDDADGTLPNTMTFTDVSTGTYTVEETSVLGFDVFVSCVDVSGDTTISGKVATIKAALGETVTCTFTNEKQIPEISIDDVTIVEGTGGTTTMEFTVSRSNNFFDTSVTANSADGTADSPADYGPIINEVINFAANGDFSKTVSVDIVTDAIVEADETFFINLSNAVNGTIIDAQGEGTIENDDKATLKLSGGTSRTETDSGQVSYVFNAILYDGVQGGFTIDIANLDLTATVADNDYEANSDTLTFVGTPNELHTFTIKVNGDEKVEADEKFAAQFTSDPDTPLKDDIMITTEVGRFDLDYHTATIFNDDIAILKLSGGTSVDEGDSGQKAYVFTATLQDAVQGGFDIDYANLDKTAKVADGDYNAVSGMISFIGVEGEQHQVTVYVNGDGKVEADEIFALAFTSDPQTPLADDIKISGAPGKIQKFHEATIFNDDIAVVTLSGSTAKAEGDSGTNTFTFTAKLNADVDGGFDLPFTTNDGSAKESDFDYVDNDGILRFSGVKGEEKTITVQVNGDTVGEAHETFTVALGAASPDTAGVDITTANSPQTGTITNDDAGVMFLDVGNGEVDEDAGTLTVEVELSNVKGVAVAVDYDVTAGTATANDDFTPMSGTLNFGAGELVKEINIPIVDDNWAEASESIAIALSNVSGADFGNPDSAEVLIIDDEPAPVVSLAATAISVSESASSAVVRLELSGPSQAAVSVRLSSLDDSAKGGVDFTALDQVITFAPGETSATATIEILGDDVYERDETLELVLSSPVNAEASADSSVLTIQEDDPAPSISVSDVSATEPADGEKSLTFELVLSAHAAVDIEVKFETADGTAVDGSDYLSSSGTLVIPAGSTKGAISITVLSDEVDEGDETFTLRLFDISDGVLDGVASGGTVTGTITTTQDNNTNNGNVIYLPVINR